MTTRADVMNAYIKGGCAAVLEFDIHDDEVEDDPLLVVLLSDLHEAWNEVIEFFGHFVEDTDLNTGTPR